MHKVLKNKVSRMYALVDCNNFYVSCERTFQPKYEGRPVIVLSNNDGCVISRSAEAKKLGVGMAVPLYQLKNDIAKHGIKVFSSNYSLYGNLSARVMKVLELFSPEVYVYSIDEAFLRLKDLATRFYHVISIRHILMLHSPMKA